MVLAEGAIPGAADQGARSRDGKHHPLLPGQRARDPFGGHRLAVGMRNGAGHAHHLIVAGEQSDRGRVRRQQRAQQESRGPHGHEEGCRRETRMGGTNLIRLHRDVDAALLLGRVGDLALAERDSVWSLPMPTPSPGCHLVPRWRMMMLPARTRWPPDFLTPRRRPIESRPLREEPPAFLCAMSGFLYFFFGLAAGFLVRAFAALAARFFAAGLASPFLAAGSAGDFAFTSAFAWGFFSAFLARALAPPSTASCHRQDLGDASAVKA